MAMNAQTLSDVQISNLTLLLTIRDGIVRDKPAACSRCALDAAQAEGLGAMTVQQTMALVANVSHCTLFHPRGHLLLLLEAQLPLARPPASVQRYRA
jgi:hypothetical protein